MTDADRELQVFESEDGILLWGVPEALALVDEAERDAHRGRRFTVASA